LSEFDRAAIAAEIAEVIGIPPSRPDGYVTIAECAEDWNIGRSSVQNLLQTAVERGELERLLVIDKGRRMWVFRVKHK